eukprot:FR739234.1.p1 GENE.FR739234.1~~FR739234.1.p1  ORF type:complete len:305 (+),score=20.77 FR739234.1:125-916(+)
MMAILIEAYGVFSGVFWTTWFSYVAIFGWLILMLIWITRMNKGLNLYPAIFIIPLLQAGFIFFAIVSGGIYFQEFNYMTWQQWCGFIPAVSSIFVGIYLIAPVDEDEDEEDEEFCSKEEVSSRQRKDSLTVGVDIGDICNVQQETISGLSPMNAGNTGTMPQKRSRRNRPSDTGINVDFKQIDNFRRGSNATKSRMMFMGASRMNEHNLSRKMEAFAEEQRLQVLLCKKSLSAKDVKETKNLMNRLIAEAKIKERPRRVWGMA